MRILVVRLSSLGDVVHAVPAVAGLRRTFPDARIDWLVDDRYRELVDLVAAVDRRIGVPRTRLARLPRLVRGLREARYDVALDLQGLLKSALLARSAGAPRLIGLERTHLRERPAGWLYSETPRLGNPVHVIERNLALVACLGVRAGPVEFPIAERSSAVVREARDALGADRARPFALVNPGAAWASKRWPPARFGALARGLASTRGLRSVVLWGPGERGAGRAGGRRRGRRRGAGAGHDRGSPRGAGAGRRGRRLGRYRSAPCRRRCRRPDRRHLRAERSAAERTLVTARRRRVAPPTVPLPVAAGRLDGRGRPALRAGAALPRVHSGRGRGGRRGAPARRERCLTPPRATAGCF